MAADEIRLGHALRCDGEDEALLTHANEIAWGRATLTARTPSDTAVVTGAEQLLGYSPSTRPIYTFLGDLHPALGEIGLVFSRSWASREAGSVTRCDSGGLFGGKGDFQSFGGTADRQSALQRLSTPNTCGAADWEATFRDEVDASYTTPRTYVDGDRPDSTSWSCERASVLAKLTGDRDRRLWTWEVRMVDSPHQHDLEAVILPAELAKLDDPDDQMLWPERVPVIRGSASPAGAQADATRAAFNGVDARAYLAGEAQL